MESMLAKQSRKKLLLLKIWNTDWALYEFALGEVIEMIAIPKKPWFLFVQVWINFYQWNFFTTHHYFLLLYLFLYYLILPHLLPI